MSEFLKGMFGGKPEEKTEGDKALANRAFSLAEQAAFNAVTKIFETIEAGAESMGDMRKVYLIMVAAHMVVDRMKHGIAGYAKLRGEEKAEPVQEMWDNVQRIFNLSEEERKEELRKRGQA